jgi:hypothetical protein
MSLFLRDVDRHSRVFDEACAELRSPQSHPRGNTRKYNVGSCAANAQSLYFRLAPASEASYSANTPRPETLSIPIAPGPAQLNAFYR